MTSLSSPVRSALAVTLIGSALALAGCSGTVVPQPANTSTSAADGQNGDSADGNLGTTTKPPATKPWTDVNDSGGANCPADALLIARGSLVKSMMAATSSAYPGLVPEGTIVFTSNADPNLDPVDGILPAGACVWEERSWWALDPKAAASDTPRVTTVPAPSIAIYAVFRTNGADFPNCPANDPKSESGWEQLLASTLRASGWTQPDSMVSEWVSADSRRVAAIDTDNMSAFESDLGLEDIWDTEDDGCWSTSLSLELTPND